MVHFDKNTSKINRILLEIDRKNSEIKFASKSSIFNVYEAFTFYWKAFSAFGRLIHSTGSSLEIFEFLTVILFEKFTFQWRFWYSNEIFPVYWKGNERKLQFWWKVVGNFYDWKVFVSFVGSSNENFCFKEFFEILELCLNFETNSHFSIKLQINFLMKIW